MRNEVDSAMLSLLQETVVPLLQNFSCGGSFGWRRVAYLNMSDPSQQCPSVWREYTTPHRVCGRRSTSSSGSCEGLTYSTGSEQYNQVCGRIIGYQLGNTDSFLGSSRSIDSDYVDGVSVTHGTPHQHIWTFSNGLDAESLHVYINKVRLTTCGRNITTLEIHPPISLMSHLSSSPMGVFSRGHGKATNLNL